MKKLVFLLATAFVFATVVPAASAAPASSVTAANEIDATFGFGSGPGDFDAAAGFSFGAGTMLPSIDKNLQARIDVSYFDFSRDFFSTTPHYTRIPITISGRYYVPLDDRVRIFGQVGIETSVDSKDEFTAFGLQSRDHVRVGITPGAGIEFFFTPDFSVFALGNAHLVSDSYFSMHLGAAVHF